MDSGTGLDADTGVDVGGVDAVDAEFERMHEIRSFDQTLVVAWPCQSLLSPPLPPQVMDGKSDLRFNRFVPPHNAFAHPTVC